MVECVYLVMGQAVKEFSFTSGIHWDATILDTASGAGDSTETEELQAPWKAKMQW